MATPDASRKPVVIFRSEKGPDDPYAKVGTIGSRGRRKLDGYKIARQVISYAWTIKNPYLPMSGWSHFQTFPKRWKEDLVF